MAAKQHDIVIIGGGPGGYIAAIRAAQLGLNTACIEMEKALGGTCLRIGCIPSKALLESSEKYEEAAHSLKDHGIDIGKLGLNLDTMMKRKDAIVRQLTNGVAGLFKKHKVTHYIGKGRITGPGKVAVEGDNPSELEAKHIIIATGSISAPLKGVEVDGDRIGTSTEALAYPEVPEHLVVIGAGAIGLEMGSVWKRLGAKVTVFEYLDHILPGMDREITKEAQKLFKKQGIEFNLGARVTGARKDKKGCVVEVEGKDPVKCDRVLLSVGRIPYTEGLGLDTVNVKLDKRGRIEIGDNFKTGEEGIYAIGDVIPGAMLAHKAEEEGVACVEGIVNGHGHIDYNSIPAVVYTHPEVAAVGQTEEQLKEADIPYRTGTFPFLANGRAKALGSTEGKVKIIAHKETDRILGVHIVGPRAGDLIAEAAIAIAFHASAEDIAYSSHAHPTLAECMKEAALAVDGRPLNI